MFQKVAKKVPPRLFYPGAAAAVLAGVLAVCALSAALFSAFGDLAVTGHKRASVLAGVDSMRQSSDDLTRFARMYAATGNSEFAENYRRILEIRNGLAPYPENYEQIYWDLSPESRRQRHPDGPAQPISERIGRLPLIAQELLWLQRARDNSERLAVLETEMFKTIGDSGAGEAEKLRARDSVFSEKYRGLKSVIMAPLDSLLTSLEARYLKTEEELKFRVIKLSIVFAAAVAALLWFAAGAAVFARRSAPSAEKDPGTIRMAVITLVAGAFMLISGLGLFYTHVQAVKTAGDTLMVHSVANEMRRSSDDLTRFARLYAITGDSQHAEDYQTVLDIRNGKAPRPVNYHHIYWELLLKFRAKNHPAKEPRSLADLLAQTAASPEETALIESSQKKSDNLAQIESFMFEVFGDSAESEERRERALNSLFGEEYLKYKSDIMEPIDDLLSALKRRYTKSRMDSPKIINALLAVFAAAFAAFAALLFILAKRMAKAAASGGGAP